MILVFAKNGEMAYRFMSDKLKELHDQRLPVKFFMDKVLEYVSHEKV